MTVMRMTRGTMRVVALVALAAACHHDVTPRPPASPAAPISNQVATPVPPAPPTDAGPSVTSIKPDRGEADGGTYAVIHGSGFLADGARAAKVYFGAQQGMVVRFASDTELIVQAPAGKLGDKVDVVVIFEPGGEHRLPGAFTFVTPRK